MGVVKEPLAQWEIDILKQLADEKPNNVGLTGGQLLEILSRLEQAEQDAYGFREGYEILKRALIKQGERLEQAEKNADTYQTLYEQRAESLEQAEQAVQRVREAVGDDAPSFFTNEAMRAYDKAMSEIIRALDGDGRG